MFSIPLAIETDFQSEINTLTPHVVPILDQLEGEDDSYLLYL